MVLTSPCQGGIHLLILPRGSFFVLFCFLGIAYSSFGCIFGTDKMSEIFFESESHIFYLFEFDPYIGLVATGWLIFYLAALLRLNRVSGNWGQD